jgi:hypothetical protein
MTLQAGTASAIESWTWATPSGITLGQLLDRFTEAGTVVTQVDQANNRLLVGHTREDL